jgi:hypothetical protein
VERLSNHYDAWSGDLIYVVYCHGAVERVTIDRAFVEKCATISFGVAFKTCRVTCIDSDEAGA